MTQEIQKWYDQCLTEDERMVFDERAAILEFHGNIPRPRAEKLAYHVIWEYLYTQFQKGETSCNKTLKS